MLLLPPLLLPPSLTSQMATLGLTQQMATLGLMGWLRMCLQGPRWPDICQMRSRMRLICPYQPYIKQLSPWGPQGAPWAPQGAPWAVPNMAPGPLGQSLIGRPVGPLGPWAPWAAPGRAPRGPLGPLGPQIHCYGSQINLKPCQKIFFLAFLGPK